MKQQTSRQSLIKRTLNKNLFLGKLNNIKVMHLQCALMHLDGTLHSQSVFSAKDKTIILISLGEKQSSVQADISTIATAICVFFDCA